MHYTEVRFARERHLSHHSRVMNKKLFRLVPILALCTVISGVAVSSEFRRPRNNPLQLWHYVEPNALKLKSHAALVVDRFGNRLFEKHASEIVPIASITKLMTAMVVLDSKLPMDETITITKQDYDRLRQTGSRLRAGATLTRSDMLTLTLMSSENRAAFALSRVFPGGRTEFIRRMNLKAGLLGLHDTKFGDPTGLDPLNVSTAIDLARMVRAAQRYPQIRKATTRTSATVRPYRGKKSLRYVNTNRLVRSDVWEIGLSKTGYVNEAGRCLVMMVDVKDEPIVVVLLNSYGRFTPMGDANRIRKWIEKGVTNASKMASVGNPPRT